MDNITNKNSNYAFGQLFTAVFKLAADTGDLPQRITAARAELNDRVFASDLPDDLQAPYAAILAANLDTLNDLERAELAGQIVSLAFSLCEVVSKASSQS